MNIATLEDENLELFGDYKAFVCYGCSWSSQSLFDQTQRIAGALIELGLSAGDRVVLLLPNSVEFVVSFTAILRAGAVPVVMYDDATSADIDRVIKHCQAKAIVRSASSVVPTLVEQGDVALHITVGDTISQGAKRFSDLLSFNQPLIKPVARSAEDAGFIRG